MFSIAVRTYVQAAKFSQLESKIAESACFYPMMTSVLPFDQWHRLNLAPSCTDRAKPNHRDEACVLHVHDAQDMQAAQR